MPSHAMKGSHAINFPSEWYSRVSAEAETLDLSCSAFVKAVVAEALDRGLAHELAIGGVTRNPGRNHRRHVEGTTAWTRETRDFSRAGEYTLEHRGKRSGRKRTEGVDGWWFFGPGVRADGEWISVRRDDAVRIATPVIKRLTRP